MIAFVYKDTPRQIIQYIISAMQSAEIASLEPYCDVHISLNVNKNDYVVSKYAEPEERSLMRLLGNNFDKFKNILTITN